VFHGRLPVAVVLARDREGREGQRQRTVPLGRNLLNLLKRNIVSNFGFDMYRLTHFFRHTFA